MNASPRSPLFELAVRQFDVSGSDAVDWYKPTTPCVWNGKGEQA